MGVGSELQELGRFLDDCERRAEAVDSLNVVEVTGVGDRRLTADLELRLAVDSLCAGGTSPSDPRVGPDGTVRFALESGTGLPLSTDHDVSITPTDVTFDTDDTLTVTLAATVPADASDSEATAQDESSSNRQESERSTVHSETDSRTLADVGDDGAGHGRTAGDDSEDSATAQTTGSTDGPDADSSSDVDSTVEQASDDAAAATVTSNATRARSLPSERQATDTDDAPGPDSGGLRDDDADADADDGGIDLGTEETSTKREVPPFKDPELLAAVYESCDTFAQMAEEIDMDVTGETVRRYMIQHDIHEPTSYKTGGDSSEPQPVALADGIGLPDDVTVETLIETVKNSNTIHQVKRDIDIEREDALEMLKELNLLDLVVGRLATEGEREITRDDVIDCLREASAVQ